MEILLSRTVGKLTPSHATYQVQPGLQPVGEIQCHVDGSWVFGWLGGAGFVFQNTGTLLAYCSERVTACCALQTEACALLNAMEYAIRNGFSCCNFLSDCQVLVNACTAQQPPIEVDWKAHKEIYVIWKMIKCNPGFRCCHIGREQNELADFLAKQGRLMGGSYIG